MAEITALVGLVGVLLGGAVSLGTGWLLRKREYDLRVWDKLLERRIQAHENVIAVALEMRVMVALGGIDKAGEVRRSPRVLITKEEFEGWFARAISTNVAGSPWLSIETKREANYLQDYLITLHENISSVPSEAYLSIGAVIRQDFIDLSSGLERAAFSYFEKDIRRLKLRDLHEWHKYPREETERRLKSTRLLAAWEEVAQAAASTRGEGRLNP